MTGLQAILDQISQDAQREAEGILEEAHKKADGITEAGKLEAARKSEAVIQEGHKKAQDIRDRAESAAQLERRNRLLVFKQGLIKEAVDKARVSLETAPDKEYFSTLLQLFSRFARDGKAEMRLNAKDLARLPAGFEAELKKAAPKADVTISKSPCEIESGFLLVYGGIDINCSFRAIFEDAYDELRDAAGKVLFSA